MRILIIILISFLSLVSTAQEHRLIKKTKTCKVKKTWVTDEYKTKYYHTSLSVKEDKLHPVYQLVVIRYNTGDGNKMDGRIFGVFLIPEDNSSENLSNFACYTGRGGGEIIQEDDTYYATDEFGRSMVFQQLSESLYIPIYVFKVGQVDDVIEKYEFEEFNNGVKK